LEILEVVHVARAELHPDAVAARWGRLLAADGATPGRGERREHGFFASIGRDDLALEIHVDPAFVGPRFVRRRSEARARRVLFANEGALADAKPGLSTPHGAL